MFPNINYTTPGHIVMHLFTRNKHTCTNHPAVANMRFHFIFTDFKTPYSVFCPETEIYTSCVSDNLSQSESQGRIAQREHGK